MTSILLTTPSILTDDIFVMYGGETGTSYQAQRTAAYVMAEQMVCESLGTYLVPTIVTGSFSPYTKIRFPFVRVRNILGATVVYSNYDCNGGTLELDAEAWMINNRQGIARVDETESQTGCSAKNQSGTNKQYRIVYEAGFDDGVIAGSPTALMALASSANLALQQMVDPEAAEGGGGDPGVQSFGDAGYSESRTRLKSTTFGSSARANYIDNLLKPLKIKRGLTYRR